MARAATDTAVVLATLSGRDIRTFHFQTPGTRNSGALEQRYAPDTMKETAVHMGQT